MRRACKTRAEEGKPPSTQERARFCCCGGETLSPDVGGWEGPSMTFSFSCASHSSSSVVGDQYRRAGAQRRDGGRRLLPTLSVRGDSPSRGPASCEGSDSPPPWEGEAPSPDPRGHGTLGPLSRGHCRAGCSPVPPSPRQSAALFACFLAQPCTRNAPHDCRVSQCRRQEGFTFSSTGQPQQLRQGRVHAVQAFLRVFPQPRSHPLFPCQENRVPSSRTDMGLSHVWVPSEMSRSSISD